MRKTIEVRECDECKRRTHKTNSEFGPSVFKDWFRVEKTLHFNDETSEPVDFCSTECLIAYLNRGREKNKVADLKVGDTQSE